jgi:hypothetical protein
VHAAFIRSNQDAAALQVAKLAHRQLRFLCKTLKPFGVLAQNPSGFGKGAVFRRPIEQPLANFVLETADRLADGGLGSVKLGRGPGKAALGGDCQKHP